MGASGWAYVAEYGDVAEVLQRLRWRTYESGEFYREPPVTGPVPTVAEYRAQLEQSGNQPDLIDFLVDEFEASLKRPPVTDPESLLANQPEIGTHSIIDIFGGVSETPKPFTVSPLTPGQLRHEFGTEHPDVEMVTQWMAGGAGIGSYRRSWSGAYVIAYSDGVPSHLCFTGFSGD
ncbi:hypothetical protein GCM10027053_15460 [Intrasporangium mesophilum]